MKIRILTSNIHALGCGHDRADGARHEGADGPRAVAGDGAGRPPPVRKDHAGARVAPVGGPPISTLESVPDRQRLQNPELMLGTLRGPVVLDEIQAMPDLYSVLRVLVDRPQSTTRFLILGSVSPILVKGVSETLAGRVEFVELAGFRSR